MSLWCCRAQISPHVLHVPSNVSWSQLLPYLPQESQLLLVTSRVAVPHAGIWGLFAVERPMACWFCGMYMAGIAGRTALCWHGQVGAWLDPGLW